MGGKRSFRVRARQDVEWSGWSEWCEVDGGPFGLVAVKVYSRAMPSFDKGWECGEPQVARLVLKPLDTAWLPSNTSLRDVAEAAADVPPLSGQADSEWVASHLRGSEDLWQETKSAMVPGEPPEPQNAGLALLLGPSLVRVQVGEVSTCA